MTSARRDLPQDLAACHAMLIAQDEALAKKDRQFAEQQQTIEEQQVTIDRLVADMALLKRSLFGSRRERYVEDPHQTLLFDLIEAPGDQPTDPAGAKDSDSDSDSDATAVPPRRTSAGRQRRVFPAFLPRKVIRRRLKEEEISEEFRNDPEAKRFFKKVGEQLEYEPPKLTVVELFQEVIVREEAGETQMLSAPKPSQLIDAFAGPGLLAYLTVSRFADHLPYYRQEDILSRCGFRIGRSTQWRWMFALAEGVRLLVDRMRRRALESLVLGVDETPVRMLSLAAPSSLKSYVWGMVGDRDHPYDCFYFTADRTRAGPEAFLAGFHGYLQSDAYVCYERIALESEAIHKVACWAHARRKFEELHFTAPSVRTHTAMGYFQRLYEIEDRGRDLTDEARFALRQREARPIVKQFHEWLEDQRQRELPKSKLRGAIGYMTNRWDAFERYLEHGAIPIDNNRTEAALKYAILGRKAWMFFGNEQGGETAAALFSLTKTCNRHRIDPYAYLRDIYTRLPGMFDSELDALLPDRWIADHPEHLIQERVAEAQARARRTRARRALRRKAV